MRQYAEALFESLEERPVKERQESLVRFMKVLRRNGDARKLNEILVRFEEVSLKRRGMIKVELESASMLPQSVKKEIEAALGKPVELIEKVDPKLLAGIRILLNGTILIDATALRRLEAFRT